MSDQLDDMVDFWSQTFLGECKGKRWVNTEFGFMRLKAATQKHVESMDDAQLRAFLDLAHARAKEAWMNGKRLPTL